MANVNYTQIDWRTGSGCQTGFAFSTPATGATSVTMRVSWAFQSGDQSNSGTWKDGMYIWINNSRSGRSGNAVAKASWEMVVVQGYETVNMTINYNFLPNTEYVVWFYTWAGNLIWRVDGTPTFSLSGTYGVKSTITAGNGTFGSGIPITLTRALSNVTHTLTVACAGRTETLLTRDAATSATWTPAVATYAPLITGAMSATATITCETFYNGSSVGSNTKTITVSFEAGSLNPTVLDGWADITPENTGKVSGFTCYVQSYSKVKATFDASKITPKYGAAISTYAMTIGTASYSGNPALSDILTQTGALTATLTVTDSRGQKASVDLAFTVQSYANPTLMGISFFRCDQDGTPNDEGTYACSQATVLYSGLAGENSASLMLYFRQLGGNWDAGRSITSGTALILGGFSADLTYVCKIEATDAVGNVVSATGTLPTQKWAMKFRVSSGEVKGVGFGKAAESDNVLEIPSSWNVRRGQDVAVFRGEILNLVYPVGSIYMSLNSTSPATLFGGVWERITGRFLLGTGPKAPNSDNFLGTIKDTAWDPGPGSTGGEDFHTLTVAEMPSHSHTADSTSWPKDGSAPEHGPNNWGSNGWPMVHWASIGYTGGDGYHNNMPPYLAVYMWKRTA